MCMNLSVITVTWNSKEQIGEQIRSVFSAAGSVEVEEIIVDNGSSDGTVGVIREHKNMKTQEQRVVLIENRENKGFPGANNQGVEKATGRYLLFLNPDMRLSEGSLDRIIAWMNDHPTVGIASAKLVHSNGEFNWDASPRRFPKTWEQIALILKLPHLFPRMLDHYHMRDMDPEREQEVDSVRGSFLLMRRELVERLGFAFDPRYFIWYEDVDICREAQRLGYGVVYTPIITAVDYVGQSFKKRTTLWKQKQFTKSMLVYFQKWEPWHVWVWLMLFRPVGILLALGGEIYEKIKNKKLKMQS